jgi:hypothetical protein
LKEFFKTANARNKHYWIPEKRTATIWKFAPEDYGILVSNDEIESFYKQNKQQFIDQPAAVQARRILFKINNTTDKQATEQKAYSVYTQIKDDPSKFAELAKTHSDDKQSAAKGGLLEFFSRGQKNPALERAAFRLQEDGAISSLFMSDDGIELIQRVARRQATYKTLAAVTTEIENKLRNIKFAEAFATDMQQLIEKQSLPAAQEFAQAKKACQETLQQKSRSAGDDSALFKKLFKTPVGQWAFVIDKGVGILINTLSVEKKHEPTFESAKQLVSEDYYKQQAKGRLLAKLEAAKKAAKNADIATIKDQFGVKMETTDWLKKDDQEQLKKLDDKGLPVDTLITLAKGSVATTEKNGNGYLISVVAQQEFMADEFNAKRQEIKQKLYQEEEELVKQGYIASLYRNATIKTMKDSDFSQESVPMEEPV